MQATTSVIPDRSRRNPFAALDARVERLIGADMRLIYGLGGPVLLLCGVIMLLALTPSEWLVGAAVVLEVAALGLVVTKVLAMLDEPDELDLAPTHADGR